MARGRCAVRLAVALPVACVLGLPVSAAAHVSVEAPSVVANGGFEGPVSLGSGSVQIKAGSTVGAWHVAMGSIDLVSRAGPWQAFSGRQSVDLSGRSPGSIEQSFPTVPDRCYTVGYALAGNPYGGPKVKTGYARVTQGSLTVQQRFSFDTAGKTSRNMGYVREGFSFCAQGSRATLSFVSATAGAYGPVLDDVTVTPRRLYPLPATGDAGVGGVNEPSGNDG
ncbi:choice-of-anchor C domain-containing protein [Streptosporangium album]|uniref:Choice-of-anchor C domain-containing protein n=1 Tax=Streptosporangium album TaxID=47479 RepID=A0A7W7RZH7_9ACTN|nr:choice-of-anchor C family protein [Streptosporangium album]MBB4940211.1 choice-of-anchor C domain-containing protein [Streptosporangium album]